MSARIFTVFQQLETAGHALQSYMTLRKYVTVDTLVFARRPSSRFTQDIGCSDWFLMDSFTSSKHIPGNYLNYVMTGFLHVYNLLLTNYLFAMPNYRNCY